MAIENCSLFLLSWLSFKYRKKDQTSDRPDLPKNSKRPLTLPTGYGLSTNFCIPAEENIYIVNLHSNVEKHKKSR